MNTGVTGSQSVAPRDRAVALAQASCQKSLGNNGAVIFPPNQQGGVVWQRGILHKMQGLKLNAKSNQPEHCEMREETGSVCGASQFCTMLGTPDSFLNLGRLMVGLVADDFASKGSMPVLVSSQSMFKKITEANFHLVSAMFNGLDQALAGAKVISLNSQTVELDHGITAFGDTGSDDQLMLTYFTACTGLSHDWTTVDGSKISPGQPIVGLFEPAYRGTGVAWLINLLKEVFGADAAKIRANQEARAFIEKLCAPSPSYAQTICRAVGWVADGHVSSRLAHLVGIAHLTGTGFKKLAAILPKGVGAELHNLPLPAEVLLQAQELSWDTNLRLTDWQAYTTLHGSCGMLVICLQQVDAASLIAEAAKDGIQAQIVGQTTVSAQSEVIIHSRFREGGTFRLNGRQA